MALINITPTMINSNENDSYEVIVSSEYSNNYQGWKALDGDISTYWCTVYKETNGEFILHKKTGESMKVSHIHIFSTSENYNFKNIKIFLSDDGNEYRQIYSNEISSNIKYIDLNYVYETKYIKLLCENLTSPSLGFGIYELKLYYDDTYLLESENNTTKLLIHKTLRQNLPVQVKSDKRSEIHFTEDGGIYISGNDGNLVSCNTGTLIKEVTNPLTVNPLQYGCFIMSEDQLNVVTDEKIAFDKVDGNMFIENREVQLKQGVTYEIMASIHTTHSTISGGSMQLIDHVANKVITNASVTPITNTTNASAQPLVNTIYTPEQDTTIYLKINVGNITRIFAEHSFLSVKEIRNNPVNQYGGFETEVLFDGKASNVGRYELIDNINNYDFIIAEKNYDVELDYTNIIPIMTSNTAPAPYIASAKYESSGKEAYKAFDGTPGSARDNYWYGSPIKGGIWLQIFLGDTSIGVSGFSITNPSSDGGNIYDAPPKTFDFQYSDDGIEFKTAKSIVNMKKLNQLEEIKFELDNTVKAKYFRFNFTEGYQAYMGIGEIKLFAEVQEKKSNVFLIKNNITVDGENEFFLYENLFNINKFTNKSITKIIGVKGQLPSLLSGGTF